MSRCHARSGTHLAKSLLSFYYKFFPHIRESFPSRVFLSLDIYPSSSDCMSSSRPPNIHKTEIHRFISGKTRQTMFCLSPTHFFSIVVGRFTFHVRILYARIENILRIYRVTIVIFLCRSRFVEQTRVVKRAALFKCTVQIEIEFYV